MKNQKGFSVIELIIILLVVCLIVIAGYAIYKKQNTKDSQKNSETSSEAAAASDLAKEPVLTSESKITKSGYKDCGSADYSDVTEFSYSSYDDPESFGDCFENAFADCEKATYNVINTPIGPKGVTIQYSIEGINSQSNKCRGGITYAEHSQKEQVGKYGFCDLDQALTPFIEAYTEAASGTEDEIAQRCEGPLAVSPDL